MRSVPGSLFRNDAHKALPLNETEDVRFEIVSLEEMQRTPVAKYEQDIEQDMEQDMEKDVWGFDIDNGRCVLSKQDNFYWLRIFDTKGIFVAADGNGKGASRDPRTGCRLIHMKRVGTVDKNLSGSIAGTVMVPDPDHLRFALWMGMAFAVIPDGGTGTRLGDHTPRAGGGLSGESGTGKSTHTRLWLHNISGCSLLNDDSPILRFTNLKRQYIFTDRREREG